MLKALCKIVIFDEPGDSTVQKATIHEVTTMLATDKELYVLFPGHSHLLTTDTDNPTLWLLPERQQVKGH